MNIHWKRVLNEDYLHLNVGVFSLIRLLSKCRMFLVENKICYKARDHIFSATLNNNNIRSVFVPRQSRRKAENASVRKKSRKTQTFKFTSRDFLSFCAHSSLWFSQTRLNLNFSQEFSWNIFFCEEYSPRNYFGVNSILRELRVARSWKYRKSIKRKSYRRWCANLQVASGVCESKSIDEVDQSASANFYDPINSINQQPDWLVTPRWFTSMNFSIQPRVSLHSDRNGFDSFSHPLSESG